MSEAQRALTPIDTGSSSPLVAPAPQRVSYFSPLSPPSPNPSGILLNRSYFDTEAPPAVVTAAEAAPAESPLPPPTKEQSDERDADRSRKSRSPSPHCHFAPLPKVATTERVSSTTTSRRNSAATARAKFLEANPDGQDEQFALDLSEEGPTPPSINHSAVSATTLSNSLASMQIARPLTPRTHSATRSPSISPGISRPNSAAGSAAPPIGNGPLFSPPLSRKPSTDGISHHYIEAKPTSSSRSRSGSMSVGLGLLGRSTSLSKERSASSTGSRGGDSDRDGNFSGGEKEVLGFEALRRSESAAWKEERILRGTATPPISSNPGSFIVHPTAVVGNPSHNTPIVPSHTLSKSSLAPSTTAAPLLASTLASTSQIPAPSPSLSTRRTFFVEPAVSSDRPSLSSVSGRCRPPLVSGEGSRRRTGAASNEEVVEVVQEPSQEDPDEAEEDDLNEEGEDEDDDDDEDDDEDDEEEVSGENGEKVEEEEEEEENVGIGRRTTTGGGVEVVHWHRDEVVEA